jgi:hypothetical protein
MARRNRAIRRAVAASQRYRLARKRLSDAVLLHIGDLLELSAAEYSARTEYFDAVRFLQT